MGRLIITCFSWFGDDGIYIAEIEGLLVGVDDACCHDEIGIMFDLKSLIVDEKEEIMEPIWDI